MIRPAPAAPAAPSVTPIATRISVRRTNSQAIAAGRAPSAMRNPISAVRCDMPYDVTAYSPNADSIVATIANTVSSVPITR